MPFESKAQQGYLHAHPEILGKEGLKEWDSKTDFKNLPEHVHSYTHARNARKKEAKKNS